MALHLQVACCSCILIGLLIIMVAEQGAARKLKDGYEQHNEQFVNLKINDQIDTHLENLDPLLYVFFSLSDIKVGKELPIYFPYSKPYETPKLLPKEEADSIPFSTSQLEYLLNLFSFPKGSPQAKAVEYTLKQCELESIKGETKFCANSLESLLDFATQMLGGDTHLKVLTTTRLSNSNILLQNYTILEEPRETLAPKMVACHSMPYPYAVFYCHCQESKNRLFEILLGGENGDRVKASAICHMDTSQWDKDHASFKVLKTKPGASHVCHFVSTHSLVWLAA
ncbi:BURP domain-containing protein BNM2A-like [Cucurbita moschata]|uniref:BURP domain-containing protein BNM2A-like n=1 Tax=Cucurbita moschata TaxID=3662 RepID=A0A6J1G735_CUCMO|nr:BURP domain-containing protein BNM2A-like [Cucurbita moschata]XP_022947672.1 BURP domain-containing protein BNM2A-like [Cucurbita moschata]